MLFEKLKAYAPTATPFHMPGHKRNTDLSEYLRALCAECDITEIHDFDDLHAPEGILMECMQRAQALWGAKHTRFLVNGSTGGILSAIYALGAGGGKAVIARNAHKSVYHAIEITGLEPVFVLPEFDKTHGMFLSLSPETVLKALENTPDAKFVMLTSPNYEGVISDVKAICEIAHARNIPVIVDEAHGAHLDLSKEFPGGAVKAGADIVIQSVHKTLPSLTQTAVLHVNGSLVDFDSVCRAIGIFETSSPSYLLMSSIDGCVKLMEERGEEIWSDLHSELQKFFASCGRLKKIRVLRPENCFLADDSKILISGVNAGVSGKKIMEILREKYSIELEAAYPRYAVAMTGAGTKKKELQRLLNALLEMDAFFEWTPFGKESVCPSVPESVCSQKAALFSGYELVPQEACLGRIAAEYAWAYPPGIPVFAPGERISNESLEAWREMTDSGVNTFTTRGEEGHFAVVRDRP